MKMGAAAFTAKLMLAGLMAGGAMLLPASGAQAADMGGKPDFSGVYMPYGRAVRTPQDLPFTPGAAKMRDKYLKEFTHDDDDPGLFCVPSGMPGAIWGAPFAIEIFHRPQDMTIYFEAYSQYRKIWMADHAHPDPVTRTRMGYSVAHWDGDALVVETNHLSPYPYFNRIPISSDAKIEERFTQEERKDKDGKAFKVLVDNMVLTDPKVYSQPIHIHAEARLDPKVFVIEYTCGDSLWEDHMKERGLEAPDIDSLGGK